MSFFEHRDDPERTMCVPCGARLGLHSYPDDELAPWALKRQKDWHYVRGGRAPECEAQVWPEYRDLASEVGATCTSPTPVGAGLILTRSQTHPSQHLADTNTDLLTAQALAVLADLVADRRREMTDDKDDR